MFFQMFQGNRNKKKVGITIIVVVATMVLVPLIISLIAYA